MRNRRWVDAYGVGRGLRTPRWMSPSSSATCCVCSVTRIRLLEALLRRDDVPPEGAQALVDAEQRAEDRGIRHEHIAGPITARRHPKEHVELGVASLRERMWLGPLMMLPAQHPDCVRIA